MSKLIFIPEERLSQGSEEWLQRRRIVGTATQCACVMGEPLPYQGAVRTWRELRAERAFGSTFEGNADTERGQRLEPLALEKFNEVVRVPPMSPIWAERGIDDETTGWLYWTGEELPEIEVPTIASSYDGYSYEEGMHTHYWVEIKCPRGKNSKTWKAVEEGLIPDDYYWQVVHQRATLGSEVIAEGYFMVYLSDEDYLIMPLSDDPRMKSGQFHRDAERCVIEWRWFLLSHHQPSDMSKDEDWLEIENEFLKNRMERVAIEKTADPFRQIEQEAKDRLKKIAEGNYELGADRVFGDKVSLKNVQKKGFLLDEWIADHPHESREPMYYRQKLEKIWDLDRLMADYPGYVKVENNWRVSVRG